MTATRDAGGPAARHRRVDERDTQGRRGAVRMLLVAAVIATATAVGVALVPDADRTTTGGDDAQAASVTYATDAPRSESDRSESDRSESDRRESGRPAADPSDPSDPSNGFVAPGTVLTPWDRVPGITNLDDDLAAATRAAFTAARAEGIVLEINSGWRSEALQQSMLDDAVDEYGSLDEALRWVSRPYDSHHTAGRAIDVGPVADTAWLDARGHRFGLCRTYDNEAWHFELATQPGTPCPPRLPNAAVAGA